MTNVISARATGRSKLAVLHPPMHVSRKETEMKRILLIVGLVAALAIPTAAVAAGHRPIPKARSGSVATTPKTKAKGSAPRSGLAVTVRPSKNIPAGAKTKAHTKPKAGTRSGLKPKAAASAGTATDSVQTKRNKTAGTPAVGVTLNQRGGSATSGKQGIGGVALPISISRTSV
jgi:hypothetical protein